MWDHCARLGFQDMSSLFGFSYRLPDCLSNLYNSSQHRFCGDDVAFLFPSYLCHDCQRGACISLVSDLPRERYSDLQDVLWRLRKHLHVESQSVHPCHTGFVQLHRHRQSLKMYSSQEDEPTPTNILNIRESKANGVNLVSAGTVYKFSKILLSPRRCDYVP